MTLDEALSARAMNEERDELDRLICPHIGCKTKITAMTGLQELNKLRTHWARKHNK